jgi:UDP-sugar transporter A1/2/3
MYMMTNMLAYYALARVEASVYTVILQLKIFTTAGLSVVILGKHISMTKWRALFLLVIGCILVVSPTFNQCICDEVGITNRRILEDSSHEASSAIILLGNSIKMSFNSIISNFVCSSNRRLSESKENNSEDSLNSFDSVAGIVAVLAMVTLSGYAAVYFEGMLKEQKTKMSVWERNFQLALYSIVILIGVMLWERQYKIYLNRNSESADSLESYVPFKGWTHNTVIIVILQSGGGLLVAATLKYADAILKTLATCGAIVISAILGYFFLGGSLDVIIAMGCVCTILAIFNYTFEEKGDSH